MQGNIALFLQPVFEFAELSRNRQHSPKSSKLKDFKLDSSTTESAEKKEIKLPNEFSGKKFLTFLLPVNAEIEQDLRGRYLYAAHSVAGEQIREAFRNQIRKWQRFMLIKI